MRRENPLGFSHALTLNRKHDRSGNTPDISVSVVLHTGISFNYGNYPYFKHRN